MNEPIKIGDINITALANNQEKLIKLVKQQQKQIDNLQKISNYLTELAGQKKDDGYKNIMDILHGKKRY